MHKQKYSIPTIIILLCVLGSLICLSCNEKSSFNKKDYTSKRVVRNYKRNNTSYIITNKEKENSLPNKPKTVEEKKKINTNTNSISLIEKRQNKYFIIASSHTTKSKAIKISQKYISKGFQVHIVVSDSKYRVTLHSEANKQKAIEIREQLKVKLNRSDLWLLRF